MPSPKIPLDDPRVWTLAKARQQLAHDCTYLDTWEELTDEDRKDALPAARNYLESAINAGLVPAAGPAGPVVRHTLTLDLDDEHTHFVLSEALREFAARQRVEADGEAARMADSGDDDCAQVEHRRAWVAAADALLDRIGATPDTRGASAAFTEFTRIADRNREARAAAQPRMDALVARHKELVDACDATLEEFRVAREAGDADRIAAAEIAQAEAYRLLSTEGLAAMREHAALAAEHFRRGDELSEASRGLFRPT
ncbi:hypothetical protein OG339_47260 (plasmid) [Streptosporangium sp. NBC_01495]|uniref:hypothetical protein n=1 Tax=Streptosporangium sp. NBC_01495 TaxID=2903899 RepID=UPI002E357714|nr:hypothetical protein [Streptosporangium sp. NBC_01495]